MALAISAMLLFVTVNAISLVLRGAPDVRKKITALADIDQAAHWLTRDVVMGLHTDLENGAPPEAQMTITWTDYTKEAEQEESVSHSVTYTHSGTQLQRNYDGVVTVVGRNVTGAWFSINDRVITVTLSCSIDGDSSSTFTRNYKILMRGETGV